MGGSGQPQQLHSARGVSSSLGGGRQSSKNKTAVGSPRTSMDLGSAKRKVMSGAVDVRIRKSSHMLKRNLESGGALSHRQTEATSPLNYNSGKTLETKDTTTQNSSQPKFNLQHPVPRDVENFARDPLDVLQTNDELFGK
jgi:hypothetical protein